MYAKCIISAKSVNVSIILNACSSLLLPIFIILNASIPLNQ